MALKTAEQYYDSLRRMHPTAYVLGEKVAQPCTHALIQRQCAAVAQTYALAENPEYKSLLVGYSGLIGGEVNPFNKLYESIDDLVNKVKMLRLISNQTGCCFVRCTGMDMMNSTFITTYEIDRKYGTQYHHRFVEYLKYIQTEDLAVHSGVTDVKGDRSKRPSEQVDPDLYLHVVEKNDRGIIVRGAKAHQTGSLCCHEVIVGPTRRMLESDKDYAVSFAIPTDSPGIIHIYGRGTLGERNLSGVDLGNIQFSKFVPMVIFNNVFIPWERVFLCGEYEFASRQVELFGDYHRHSHGGCKSGMGDVLVGAAAAIADYNAASGSHINNKLTEMVKTSETMYGCCLAASYEAKKNSAGTYMVDTALANTSKLYEGKEFYEVIRLMMEIAGGLVGDLPSEKDLQNPEVGPLLQKYLKGAPGVSTEDRMRMFRLIEKLAFESGDIASQIHGGGSPEAHRMALLRATDLEAKKKLAKRVAGIKE
jgi:4-hydroxybutyryl-CoA dehydratase/vinylacetyl-CoA-Delta-isomerase